MEPAAQLKTGVEHIPQLGEAEGHGMGGPDGRPHHLARIAVNPGWDIEAEHRLGAPVDLVDDVSIEPLYLPREACPEDGVYDSVAMGHGDSERFDIFKRLDFDREPLEDLQVQSCEPHRPERPELL